MTARLMKRAGAVTVALLCLLLGCVMQGPVLAQECTADGRCDTHERCPVWKEEGQCLKNSSYMREHCPASCADYQKPKTRRGECKDYHVRCPIWAEVGECDENPADMHKYCPKSCETCDESEEVNEDELCMDDDDRCAFWASKGECEANPAYMHTNCAKSCATCAKKMRGGRQTTATGNTAGGEVSSLLSSSMTAEQKALVEATTDFGELQQVSGDDWKATVDVIEKTIHYMKTETGNLPNDVLDKCMNRHELCAFWVALGECEKNRAYMMTNCAPSCLSCQMIDMDTRCPPIPDAVPALKPGDLNKMFERIVDFAPGNRTLTDAEKKELAEDNMSEFTVNILSRPSEERSEDYTPAMDLKQPPWVITFDDFLTEEECDTLIQLGYDHGYERSKDVGGQNFDGSFKGVESTGRTSENAWCSQHAGCRDHAMVQSIHNRMAKVMGIPAPNSEDLQVLKYEVGQFYQVHHDYIEHQVERQCGPRILTFFLYLSDVEAGGGTHFPQLDIEVRPKKGRALLWPSVLNSRPMEKDGRTTHAALAVQEGTKFAANGWIHMYDYLAPQLRGCN